MTAQTAQTAAIHHNGRCVLASVPVELELDDRPGRRWSGVFEAGGADADAWPTEPRGTFHLHLPDGRAAAFTPTRQCGRDLGTTVILVQGLEPLTRPRRTPNRA